MQVRRKASLIDHLIQRRGRPRSTHEADLVAAPMQIRGFRAVFPDSRPGLHEDCSEANSLISSSKLIVWAIRSEIHVNACDDLLGE